MSLLGILAGLSLLVALAFRGWSVLLLGSRPKLATNTATMAQASVSDLRCREEVSGALCDPLRAWNSPL